jgi:hypothetical protein
MSEGNSSPEEIQTDIDIDPKKIGNEILEMVRQDQKMRKDYGDGQGEMSPEIDKANQRKISEIITRIGWPSDSKYGAGISTAAWLLIQHADDNVPLQEKALHLMKTASEEEVKQEDVAYLEDRIRKNKHEPQLYGTQGMPNEDGKFEPYPIEDPQHLDERRLKMGMMPFAIHKKMMDEMYEKFKPQAPKE